MVIIRLARGGSKKKPFYHIVVTNRRMPRDGRFIEQVGYYNPMARGHDVRLRVEKDRIAYWLSQGAAASLRVKHLFKQLKKSPKEAQKGDPRKGELKRAQAEQSAKAQKAKMAEEAKAKEEAEALEASKEEP
ncbi:30S ribosomal protein S16 [Candidatus Coxiella mudrowiae]|uniref:Small ribosomal subunit protein bS16 n=1 Tax=Candidatus Coxiella mudrowiae TaxID=2054173 RepID=A0ABN4HQE1_9COXI|nr:30S ribosomal protein S16 [Candidatus Coxiella mudrowiae]